MATETYNLDEAQESFEFVLNGHHYLMRYPNTEELEPIQQSAQKVAELTDQLKKEPERANEIQPQIDKLIEQQGESMYTLVTPKTEGAPPISEALKEPSMHVGKLRRFSEMLKKEMSLE